MSEPDLKLQRAPIVEAVLDIDCDMPVGQKITSIEGNALACFHDQYPRFQTRLRQDYGIKIEGAKPTNLSLHRDVQALQFVQQDNKQLVQIRVNGFSFNRLAPYTSLDDYLEEIKRLWDLFINLASPVQIRVIRLRYINRIPLPMTDHRVELDEYFKVAPHLPDEQNLRFTGFLNQHLAVEKDTGHQVNILLTMQQPEGDTIPIIFDNCVAAVENADPENWTWIQEKIQALRALKNRVFRDTFKEKCLNLFR